MDPLDPIEPMDPIDPIDPIEPMDPIVPIHPTDPIDVVGEWLADARRAGLPGADTMIVATATTDGAPSARAVILRGLDHRGFVFYTDTRSRKGRELAANPRAAVALVWDELE
ncbi:MAG: pyridoxamine 5'-phosphate oxidase family protein, partial [Actinomycetota bacterium]|nr:pyridoxamine 5'-phosphate oxidase family protein [Actinomycetota bacterium]